jgi:S-adenosylmethionine:tRNA ribosyltransferase-isomerase
MRVELFDFELPEDRIALRPANPRDAARLLVVDGQKLEDRKVNDLCDLLKPGDLVVLNDTKVFPAELTGVRPPRDPHQGGPVKVQFSLHKELGQDTWAAFAKPARRVRGGDDLDFGGGLCASVLEDPTNGEVKLRFNRSGETLFLAFHAVGAPPLPPYILSKRKTDQKDRTDYQTVFAEHEGSVAAPTAGLHFTNDLMDRLASEDISFCRVTLHVGAGTFLPMKALDTNGHKMHAEWGSVSRAVADKINQTKEDGGRVICIGTTSLRLLESASRASRVEGFSGETDIFITPGYEFKVADILMTNFHLPKSTLFMLVSAFAGLEEMQGAYAHAISEDYRFYSYGDASLLYRNKNVQHKTSP